MISEAQVHAMSDKALREFISKRIGRCSRYQLTVMALMARLCDEEQEKKQERGKVVALPLRGD